MRRYLVRFHIRRPASAVELVTSRRTRLNLMRVIRIIRIQTQERQIALPRTAAIHAGLGIALHYQMLSELVAIVTRGLQRFDVGVGLSGESDASHRQLIGILTDRYDVRRHRNATGYNYEGNDWQETQWATGHRQLP
jgi:hypothetical protein